MKADLRTVKENVEIVVTYKLKNLLFPDFDLASMNSVSVRPH